MNSAALALNKIHDAVQDSGLHFVINRTPFSSYITIRQKFVNDQENKMLENSSENAMLNQLVDLKARVEKLQDEKIVLEEMCVLKEEEILNLQHESDQKLQNLHNFTDKLEAENEKLKDMVANCNVEISEFKVRASKSSKAHKSNEKEIYNLNRNVVNMQETIKNLKAEKVLIKNEKNKVEADLKRLDKKVNKKKKVENSTSQTDLEVSKSEYPTNPKLLSTALPPCSKSTDLGEDSFSEFDARVIDDNPNSETEPVVISSVRVENMFEKLSAEAIGEKSTESTSTISSTSYLLEFMAEQMKVLSSQMDQGHAKISETLRK